MDNTEIAKKWILEHIDIHEFKDDEVSEEELIDWYAYEMSKFAHELDANKPMADFIKENYKVESFFEDHEKVAAKYYE